MEIFATIELEGRSPSLPVYLLIALLLSGCAATSVEVDVQLIPPDNYQHLTCQQIGAEGERIARRVAEFSGEEYTKTSGGMALLAQPIVVRWPAALPALTTEGTVELSKLKSEFEALAEASALKRCSFHFQQRTS